MEVIKFLPVLRKRYHSWDQLEAQINALPTTKQKGDAFEQFMYCFIKIFSVRFDTKDVYLTKDAPENLLSKYDITRSDAGVDGILVTNSGKVIALQAKFRDQRKTPSYDELTKFWNEARHCDQMYTFANAYYITNKEKKHSNTCHILVNDLLKLDDDFFLSLFEMVNQNKLVRHLKTPWEYQKLMIDAVIIGFESNDRGKLIAACGTGKTLVSMWIAEGLDVDKLLFVAPSIALVKQTLENWTANVKDIFSYICVCSDKTVINNLEDEYDIPISDVGVPVTTSAAVLREFLSSNSYSRKFVFSTYQSLDVVVQAMSELPDFKFDLTICDEAHRTAGAKNSQLFSLALDDQYIPASKRLFMTATERMVRPFLQKKAEEKGQIIFSMDDEKNYGPVFFNYNFGMAIQDHTISDYKIIVAAIEEEEIYKYIKGDANLITNIDNQDLSSYAQMLFARILLSKSMSQFPIHKVISFHSSIANAEKFTSDTGDNISLRAIINKSNSNIKDEGLFIGNVSSKKTAGDRNSIMDSFAKSKYGIVSNAKCLTEGVDVPVIDSVYFVDKKSSLVDIVQACGRALRKPHGDDSKTAYFIIPILIPKNTNDINQIFNLDSFETVFDVIQSLRDQDFRLADWIDELNRRLVKGDRLTDPKDPNNYNPVDFSLPKRIDLKKFEESLLVNIATVNKDPMRFAQAHFYGKLERKTSQKRIFTTIADYSFKSLFENLADPTLKKFDGCENSILTIDTLQINHNNVSHTQRLGLIDSYKKGQYVLTDLGREYLHHKISSKDLFKQQMLRYYVTKKDEAGNERVIFPYRMFFNILSNDEIQKINFYEFAFGIFNIYDGTDNSTKLAISDILYLRQHYANLAQINESNKESILAELNRYFCTKYSVTDIWGSSPTTVKNQFIYFKNNIGTFDDIVNVSNNVISMKEGVMSKLEKLMAKDKDIETIKAPKSRRNRFTKAVISMIVFSGT